ncbi:hypothetical protein D6764_01705 [Candidatus Woesearchaeota archaeon]|nr:MAG: hypothetical protein D6764_01705 [Candidatus Woesearchaeota archaeon]
MVFESINDAQKAERHPWEMLLVGVLYSSLAVIISLLVFKEHASLVMIFLTVLASVHLMYNVIKLEEKKDLDIKEEKVLMSEHWKALKLFVFLFIGFTLSYSAWYVILPHETSTHLFSSQIATIKEINNPGQVHIGNAVQAKSMLSEIFFNNLKVLVLCAFFAFFYGVGAIFILTWNASVVGAAIGTFVESLGGSVWSAYLAAMLRYFTHGIPEMAAYFMAGLGGGIISFAIIRHDFGSDKFKRIALDSADLLIGAVFLLFLAAVIEVFLTPLLFA